jgi:methyl-accepting chemotaxis protein
MASEFLAEYADGSSQHTVMPLPFDVNPSVLAQLSESNLRIAEIVDGVRSLTEREVLACGNVVSDIVSNARRLAAESESSLAASIARSEEINDRFVRDMQQDILAQTTAVNSVLDLAKGIEEAVAAINDLTVSSRVLAINARIEAARLGEQGRGFAVIADNLSELSRVIRASSDKVSTTIGAVRLGLQPVSEHAASMDDRTKRFVDDVADQVKLSSLHTDDGQSTGPLASITELANQALSHLQFQDPMAQKLLSINRDLEHVKGRVASVLNGETTFDSAQDSHEAGFSDAVSGEVMLF